MRLRGGKSLLGICLIVTLLGCSGVASQRSVSQASQTSATSTPLNVNVPVDRYGGRLDISCTATAGKWHTEKINGRWWVCTPAAHGFFKQSLYVTSPASNLNINAKYGSYANYVNAQLARFRAWGFNAIDTSPNSNFWPIASPTPAILTPFVVKLYPSLRAASASGTGGNAFSDNNGFAAINYVVQNLWAAMPDSYYQFVHWNPVQADPMDPGIAKDATAQLQTATLSNEDYLMEVQFDDADQEWGLRYDANQCPGPDGNNHQHMGWVSLASSAGMYEGSDQPYNNSSTAHQYLSYNPQHVSKAGLETFLKNRYNNSISALNTAWGSSYTQFDSTGTTVTGEAVASGDGRTTAYNYTLAHNPVARYSVGITIGGTLVAGDYADFNVSGVTGGLFWGPYASGTMNVTTGALSVTFSTTANQRSFGVLAIRKISVANNVVTVQTGAQHGLWTGAKVNISGTTNYNGTALGPITVLDSITFTYSLVGSFEQETSGTFGLTAVPGASDTIKVNYSYNGWGVGTGLMDEANNHSWSNVDQYDCNLSLLSTAMQTDLNDYLYQMVNTYFSRLKTAANNRYPKAMYAGFDSLDIFRGVKVPIMKAVKATLDVVPTAYGTASQSQLDSWYTAVGEVPFYDSNYFTATLDSPNANSPDTTSYYTQDAKGQAYYALVQSLLNTAYSATGTHPYVGIATWSYVDMNDCCGYRFGLITPEDNAYDGHEDVSASVSCSPPLQAYMCGSESYTTPLWAMSTSYQALRNIVGLVSGTYYIFTTIGGGTSGGSQPNWTSSCPNVGNTCTDNTVTWTNEGVWTKSANPSYMGNAITPNGGGVRAGNALWLGVSP